MCWCAVKKLLTHSLTHNIVNFSPLAAENGPVVWGYPLQISTGLASWQRYCTALQHWASTKFCGVEQMAPPIFGRAVHLLGIGPHSFIFNICCFAKLKDVEFRYFFLPIIEWREPKCVVMPTYVAIGQSVAEIWPFEFRQIFILDEVWTLVIAFLVCVSE